MWKIIRWIAAALMLASVHADISLDWTEHSKRASLPQSVAERQKLKDKLAQVNPDNLSPEKRREYYEFKALLDGADADGASGGYGGSYSGGPPMTWWIIVAVIGGLFYKFQM